MTDKRQQMMDDDGNPVLLFGLPVYLDESIPEPEVVVFGNLVKDMKREEKAYEDAMNKIAESN